MALLATLAPNDVPMFETFVVPRYLTPFARTALRMAAPCDGAVVANIGCRTGFPDRFLTRYLDRPAMIGFDSSQAALDLARAKAALIPDVFLEYRQASDPPLPVQAQAFSHALALHPIVNADGQAMIIAEMFRVLAWGGQALLAVPLRGSFQELTDLLKEYAVKHDADNVAQAIDASVGARPTPEVLTNAFEAVGLSEIDVDVRSVTLAFRSGRDFFDDPIARLMVVPDLELTAGIGSLTVPFNYVRDAIDRYWSERDFELTLIVGCASGRRF